MGLRSLLSRVPYSKAAYRRARRASGRFARRATAPLSYRALPDTLAVRLAYQVMLDREPDSVGWEHHVGALRSGNLRRPDLAHSIRGSDEFQNRAYPGVLLSTSIHAGRCQFIRSLPPARRIVDLGGTHLGNDIGALVTLGYPYTFDNLTIIDLPAEDRHPIYRAADGRLDVHTRQGTVTYRYHSMVDLSYFDDASVDLVYSGQSIEHVTPDEGAIVAKEVARILRPGGFFALDTPNGRVTRLHQAGFIDPDHKVEYTWPHLRELLGGAGLEIHRAQGLNWGGPIVDGGRLDPEEAARHFGLHDDLERCYVLAVVCRKPEEVSSTLL